MSDAAPVANPKNWANDRPRTGDSDISDQVMTGKLMPLFFTAMHDWLGPDRLSDHDMTVAAHAFASMEQTLISEGVKLP